MHNKSARTELLVDVWKWYGYAMNPLMSMGNTHELLLLPCIIHYKQKTNININKFIVFFPCIAERYICRYFTEHNKNEPNK